MGRFDRLPAHDGRPPAVRLYQLAPPAIQDLTALCEAAEGIGLVRTLDERRGIVECWIMPDFAADFDRLLEALAARWPIQPIDKEFE